MLLDTAPTAFMFVQFPPNFVVDARRGPIVLENVRYPTGLAVDLARVTSNGAVVTSVEKRTSTGRSSRSQIKGLESEPRNCFLLE